MDTQTRLKKLLEEIGTIKRMERGKIYKQRRDTGYEFFTHDVREDGKTVTRYVPKHRVTELLALIKAYEDFRNKVQEYEDLIIRETRATTPKKQFADPTAQRIIVKTRRV
jgi:hypothetical protein